MANDTIKWNIDELHNAARNFRKSKEDIDKLIKNFNNYVTTIQNSWQTTGGKERGAEFESAVKSLEKYSSGIQSLIGLMGSLEAAAKRADEVKGGK